MHTAAERALDDIGAAVRLTRWENCDQPQPPNVTEAMPTATATADPVLLTVGTG
jgi:hypothetical protein